MRKVTFQTDRMVRALYGFVALFLLTIAGFAHGWFVSGGLVLLAIMCALICEFLAREPKRPTIREELAAENYDRLTNPELLTR